MTGERPALLGAAELRELAARLGVRPTKRLGQNFVHDANTVRRIVAVADLAADDVVLEVGPGLGRDRTDEIPPIRSPNPPHLRLSLLFG